VRRSRSYSFRTRIFVGIGVISVLFAGLICMLFVAVNTTLDKNVEFAGMAQAAAGDLSSLSPQMKELLSGYQGLYNAGLFNGSQLSIGCFIITFLINVN